MRETQRKTSFNITQSLALLSCFKKLMATIYKPKIIPQNNRLQKKNLQLLLALKLLKKLKAKRTKQQHLWAPYSLIN